LYGESAGQKNYVKNVIWTALSAEEINVLEELKNEDHLLSKGLHDSKRLEKQNPEPSLALGRQMRPGEPRSWIYLHMITDYNRQLLIEQIRDVIHKAKDFS